MTTDPVLAVMRMLVVPILVATLIVTLFYMERDERNKHASVSPAAADTPGRPELVADVDGCRVYRLPGAFADAGVYLVTTLHSGTCSIAVH
jgi:hypothetical protein